MPERVKPYEEIDRLKGARYKIGSTLTVGAGIVHANVLNKPEDGYAKNLQGKRLVLENPLMESRHAKGLKEKLERQEQLAKRKKTGVVGRNEARRKGLWKPERTAAKYHLFLPIHRLWVAYIAELLNLPPAPSESMASNAPPHLPAMAPTQGKLVKADFHGAIVTVKDSKNLALIGLRGIVVHETENTFKIVSTDHKFKVIPKRHSIFTFRIPVYSPLTPSADGLNSDAFTESRQATSDAPSLPMSTSPLDLAPSLEFELYGNQFCFRSADRATRKFKHKETLELL